MKLGARRQNIKQLPPLLLAKVRGLVVLALRVTIIKKRRAYSLRHRKRKETAARGWNWNN